MMDKSYNQQKASYLEILASEWKFEPIFRMTHMTNKKSRIWTFYQLAASDRKFASIFRMTHIITETNIFSHINVTGSYFMFEYFINEEVDPIE